MNQVPAFEPQPQQAGEPEGVISAGGEDAIIDDDDHPALRSPRIRMISRATSVFCEKTPGGKR